MTKQTDFLAPHTMVIASSNAHKISEVQEIMRSCAADLLERAQGAETDVRGRIAAITELEVRPLSTFGDACEPEENGATFEDNARIKARAAYEFLRVHGISAPVLADDSGLEVDALDGAPGVLSARYAGGHGDDAANNALVLRELERASAYEPEQRRARFVCALCYIDTDGSELVVRGTVEGYLGMQEAGAEGFGYDPLFISDAYAPRTLAQVSAECKHRVSHRGNALRALVHELCEV